MQYRKVGTSDIEVSEVSLGCWTLGGRNWVDGQPNGWADVDEAEAIEAIRYGLDQGVNHFDNADVYGNGKAERLLNKALGARSKDVIIASKLGHFKGTAEHAYTPLHIRHQCEQSLENLGRDVIDIYYFHHGNFGENDRYVDGAVETMRRLREEGKIRLIGLSAYSDGDFLRLVPKIEPDVLQSWANASDDRYIRPGSPVQKLMAERGLSFVAFSPLAQGLLLGKYSAANPPSFEPGDHRLGSDRFGADNLQAMEPKIEKLKARFGSEIKDLARMALQYLTFHDEVCCSIPGFRNKRQVEASLHAADKPLSAEDMTYIRETLAG